MFLNDAVRVGKCNTQPVNVRTGPSIDAPVAKTVGNQNLSLSKGTSVEILADIGLKIRIQCIEASFGIHFGITYDLQDQTEEFTQVMYMKIT